MTTPPLSVAGFASGAVGPLLYQEAAAGARSGRFRFLREACSLAGMARHLGVMVLFLSTFRRSDALTALHPVYSSNLIGVARTARVGRQGSAPQPMARLLHLVYPGARMLADGRLGDPVICSSQSSISRNSSLQRALGFEGMEAVTPVHGGLLGRFDGALLVAPPVPPSVGLHPGSELDRAAQISSGTGDGRG